ncbi:sushi, von Willebrand factor type A, EGF and pentraxin domain-containing protein 1-like [Watersipora subatra]|uniref:sushi, von Willebrand factor type A, EGF and pentraxin domain-containing protein 1-like n=1 Tax=Watersipora subatra TaxID=2589382 RepID=UPI00355BE353
MTGEEVERAFIVDGKCYWLISAGSYSNWASAETVCANQTGSIAIIESASANLEVAQNLDRPAFIGYRKTVEGWRWVSDSSSYTPAISAGNGAHMALADGTGDWEMTHMDAKGHIYDLLCSLDREPYMRCPSISVEHSIQSKEMPLYSGESVTFICESGFHVTVRTTVQELSCLPPNVWSFPARDCKEIECDLIEPPAYTHRNSDDHFVNDIVHYGCDNHTWFSPGIADMLFHCEGNGEWHPPLQPCQVLRCPPPIYLQHGTLDTTSTLYESEITYTCNEGYVFPDGLESKTITCSGEDLEWRPQETVESLNCTAIFCENPVVTSSGTRSATTLQNRVGDYQSWWCLPGYLNSQSVYGTTPKCLKSSSSDIPHDWDSSVAQCIPTTCRNLSPENTMLLDSIGVHFVGYNATYNCTDDTYLFPGGYKEKTITCGLDGQWDFEIALSGCDDSSCEPGWLMFKGSCYYVSNGRSLGLRYEYAEDFCQLKRAHLVLIDSIEEAEWLGTVTYEIYERDFWIGIHENAEGDWVWKGPTSTNFTNFAEGYPEFYKCARTSVKGFWKDRNCDELMPYVCKKTSICGKSPTINFGGPIGTLTFPVDVGAKITYECDENYVFKGIGHSITIECQEGGYWSEIGNCVADICPPLNLYEMEIDNAWANKMENSVGEIVTYTCNNGFLFSDGERVKQLECLPGGTWSENPGSCQELKCPKPASPDTSPTTGVDNYGDMDLYHCDPGYSFADDEIDKLFWCTRDGTWLPEGQICIPRKCPKYSVPFATVTPDVGVFQDVIVVECYRGYEFSDTSTSKSLTCTADGVWSEDVEACIATECEGPTPPDIEGAYRDTDFIQSGTEVNYTCLPPLVYVNGDTWRIAYCDIDTLQWINLPGSCVDEVVEIKTEFHHTPTEAANSLTFVGLGMGFLTTLLVAVIVCDAGTITRLLPCLKQKPPDGAPTTIKVQKVKSKSKETKTGSKIKGDKNINNEQRDVIQKEEKKGESRNVESRANKKRENEEEDDDEWEYVTDSEYETDSDEERV